MRKQKIQQQTQHMYDKKTQLKHQSSVPACEIIYRWDYIIQIKEKPSIRVSFVWGRSHLPISTLSKVLI